MISIQIMVQTFRINEIIQKDRVEEKKYKPRMEFGEHKHLRSGEPRKIRKTQSAGKR